MFELTINKTELFNEATDEFIQVKQQTIKLEHSLLSLSKWESKWEKPFLSKTPKTREESLDYIRCMTITQNVDEYAYYAINDQQIQQVNTYIEAPMTATTFSRRDKKPSREIITAELIYYWMIASNIPFDCEKWHFNRLLALIEVCGIKNGSKKKMSNADVLSQQRAINEARRTATGSRG